MKKTALLIMAVFALALSAICQKKTSIEVLYFKAPLPCCKARACSALQGDVDSVVVKYFSKENAVFKSLSLADTANNKLAEKYKAAPQTVVIVKRKKKKETSRDLTPILQTYKANWDKAAFEREMKQAISEFLKS